MLLPHKQNIIQRTGFFVVVAAVSLVLFLHFPFYGYDSEHYVITSHGQGSCPEEISIEELQKLRGEDFNERWEAMKRCTDQGEMQTLPFSEWRSKSAIIQWFASPMNSLIVILFILPVGVLWIWIFRSRKC